MPAFQSKRFRPSSYQGTLGGFYRRNLNRHPFLLFGLPFIFTMVAGSFVLTPATAIRYERHDRKVKQMTKEEELGIGKDRRRVDINEEYYRLAAKVEHLSGELRMSANEWSRIWMIGRTRESNDYRGSMMASFEIPCSMRIITSL